jgi:hypothetical protein
MIPYATKVLEFSQEWSEHLHKGLQLIFVGEPFYFSPIIKKSIELQIPLIILPQNMESLCLDNINPDLQLKFFKNEIDLLSLADLIITISREETFLLKNLGIQSFYFPYFPVDAIRQRLIAVRQKRRFTRKSGIILLGTAYNLVTQAGMREVIEFWKEHPLEEELFICGYGTPDLRTMSDGKNIRFLGEISDRRLDSEISRIKACLCFQNSGSGALIRIREMLMASVPVIANSLSSRSYYNEPGLVEISSLNEIQNAIKLAEKWDGRIPESAGPQDSLLVEAIKRVIESKA